MTTSNRPPLSPAAQAVRAAVLATYDDSIPKNDALWALESPSVAAALRAAADQVVPEGRVYTEVVPNAGVFVSTKPPARFRSKLLAIAAELEPQP